MFNSSHIFMNFPVLSLRTSAKIAVANRAIINPYNLTVQAYQLSGHRLAAPKDSFLLTEDIREVSQLGFIINDSEDIVNSTDVIKLRQTLELNFELINLKVVDKNHKTVGKVVDYTIVGDDFLIYQLIVKQPFYKDILSPELIINRSQIAKLSQDRVIIKNSRDQLAAIQRQNAIDNFVNPFRAKKAAKPHKN